jgi:hypothetical protein
MDNNFYNELNQKVHTEAPQLIAEIKKIWENTHEKEDNISQYIFQCADRLLQLSDLYEEFSFEYYKKNTFEYLQTQNENYFNELNPENYETSFLNPEFSAKEFGSELGSLLASFYRNVFVSYKHVINGAFCYLFNKFQDFIDLYSVLNNDKDYNKLVNIYSRGAINYNLTDKIIDDKIRMTPKYGNISNIINEADLKTTHYLFQYLEPITENEIQTAKFLMNYSQEKIDKLGKAIADAYILGFEEGNRDYKIKSSVWIYFNIGQERIVKSAAAELKKYGLDAIYHMVNSTQINRQFGYDHRFTNKYYLNEEFSENRIELNKKAKEVTGDLFKAYSGVVAIEKFGETPFSPKKNDAQLKLSEEQQKLHQSMRIKNRQIDDQYKPQNEVSFCIIAFPSPEIGDIFEEIFERTIEINMLDSLTYEKMQQNIIDLLDEADHVHIKGQGKNKTDIKVKLQKIKNPEKETNFVNCGASVNVPVGEVFTSPQLSETTGLLHLPFTFLNGFKYEDLALTFKDGYVVDYDCKNFEETKDNKNYIEENLMFPHKTLPLGEFAIGTNTHAYLLAKQYDIVDLLPILIVEKMGPHFAIGDTCFSWDEDTPVYNKLDGKEITARDNEKTLCRKEDPHSAYTNCHTDITIPYEELDFITAVKSDGTKLDIIRDGRFVVKGTEPLNIPLEKLEK